MDRDAEVRRKRLFKYAGHSLKRYCLKGSALNKFLKSNPEGRRSLSQRTAARLKEAGKK